MSYFLPQFLLHILHLWVVIEHLSTYIFLFIIIINHILATYIVILCLDRKRLVYNNYIISYSLFSWKYSDFSRKFNFPLVKCNFSILYYDVNTKHIITEPVYRPVSSDIIMIRITLMIIIIVIKVPSRF